MKILSFLAVGVLLSGCAARTMTEAPKNDSFSDFVGRYYENYLKFFPLEATQQGDHRFDDRLPLDISQSFRAELSQFYKVVQDSLRHFDPALLTGEEKISYAILERESNLTRKLLEYPTHLMPVNQFWGLPLTMPLLGSGDSYQPFKTVKDYDNFLKRLDGFAVWMDTAIVNMRRGLAHGYTYPKVLMERVLPQAKDMVVTDATRSIFYQPVRNIPESFEDGEKKRLREAYTRAILEKISPAYEKLYVFLRETYIPATRTTAGIGAIPDGGAYYRDMVQYWTTTDLLPDSIFSLGLSEVARIRGEMDKVRKEIGFRGDLNAFFRHVNESREYMPFSTAEEVLQAYRDIERRMQPFLPKLFNMTPKSRFEVRRTEAFREMSASAEYMVGSPDGSRPGIFYVPIPDPKGYNASGMETLFLHEAIPGHHYQLSIQHENEGLPEFRKPLYFGAYGEGWALYSESLGRALGLYTDPIQYFGHLADEMHRAIRLVVDVGMHSKGWSREQAIAYMTENEPIPGQAAVAEIERYMAIPGQALSYKIGQLKIQALRARAERELGDRFDIRSFHDEVLSHGNIPLALLEEKISEWIGVKKGT